MPVEELQGIFMNYAMIQNAINKENNEDENSESTSNESVSNNDETYGIVHSNKMYVYSKSDFNSQTEDFLIKGDTAYVGELKDGFYLFDYTDKNGKSKKGFISEDDIEIQ